MLHLLFELTKLGVRLHHHIESLLQSSVLGQQFPQTLLLLGQLTPQAVHVPLLAFELIFEVLFDADFVSADKGLHLGPFVLDGSAGLELQTLDEALRQPEFLGERSIN